MMVALAACCFGSITILVTIAAQGGASLLTILVGRYVIGAATLFLLVGGIGALRMSRGRRARLIALGGGGQAVHVVGGPARTAVRDQPDLQPLAAGLPGDVLYGGVAAAVLRDDEDDSGHVREVGERGAPAMAFLVADDDLAGGKTAAVVAGAEAGRPGRRHLDGPWVRPGRHDGHQHPADQGDEYGARDEGCGDAVAGEGPGKPLPALAAA